ncbi:hypothetical protein EG856_01525 [Mycoplasmopsis phocirhinis]|uniref:Uncharacterized protein n=1 Tax=Mycoplasmopsis phocirhinis TaxID=142650 RepID=A0A4P6MP06_9BACT|nr:hypothetical protein [Mycoplasmopsis phocirhinis]QBF34600.1 hypothetical protein EG856_01525 [Mycoplasmopsis phocirhinis]
MSRKKRLIYSLGSIVSLSLPLTVISMGENGTDSEQPNSPDDSNEIDKSTVEQPKDYDPSFSTFEDFSEKRIKQALTELPEVVISALKNEIEKLKNDDQIEYRKSLSKQIYLYALLDFFEANKEDLKNNPENYGFYITFPNVVSKLRLYERGSVQYNDKIYSNVIFGANDQAENTKYNRVVSNPQNDIKVETSQEKNFINRDNFEKTIRQYAVELLKSAFDISFNDSDVLLLDKDIELKQEKITNDTETINGFSVTTPKGYNSWKDYIIAKIKPRFIDFDLTQNQQFQPEDPQQQQQQTSPPNIPPLVPNQGQPAPANPIPPDSVAEAIPSLAPYVRSEHATKSLSELSALITTNSKDVFFFNNPINTRFEYEVVEIKDKEARVSVYEKEKPNLKRVYPVAFNFEANRDPILQKIRYTTVESIKNTVLKFYESLGLDDKIDFKKLNDPILANSFFSVVDLFVKLVYSDLFVQEQEKNIDNWRKRISNINDNKAFSKVARQAKAMFISYVFQSKLNNSNAWTTIPNAYETFVQRYKIDVFRLNKDIITENINLLNTTYKEKLNNQTTYTIRPIDEFFVKTERDVSILKSNSESNPRNLNSWYDEYIQQISGVRKNFTILRTLADSKKIDDNNFKDYDAAYQEALKQNSERSVKVQGVKKEFGISMLVLGSLILTLFIILIALNIKTVKQRKLRNVYITLLAITLSVMLAGVLLILI